MSERISGRANAGEATSELALEASSARRTGNFTAKDTCRTTQTNFYKLRFAL
jgi:hypothetical protein